MNEATVYDYPDKGVASLVLGIISFPLTVLGIPTAIIAIVFGHKTIKSVDSGNLPQERKSFATAGKILGIVHLCLTPIVIGIYAIASIGADDLETSLNAFSLIAL